MLYPWCSTHVCQCLEIKLVLMCVNLKRFFIISSCKFYTHVLCRQRSSWEGWPWNDLININLLLQLHAESTIPTTRQLSFLRPDSLWEPLDTYHSWGLAHYGTPVWKFYSSIWHRKHTPVSSYINPAIIAFSITVYKSEAISIITNRTARHLQP